MPAKQTYCEPYTHNMKSTNIKLRMLTVRRGKWRKFDFESVKALVNSGKDSLDSIFGDFFEGLRPINLAAIRRYRSSSVCLLLWSA